MKNILIFSAGVVDNRFSVVYNLLIMENAKKYFICESRSVSPYRNLAAEEYLMRTLPDGASLLFLWQNDDTIVIGKNQNCYAECRVAELTADGGHLARRMSGGGAVRHDMGNLCFSFIARGADYDVPRQLSIIAAACREFGIDAEPTGRNDITAAGAKFSGNAFFSVGDVHCHHGTVLINCDFDAMARYLTVKKSKLQAKGIESVRSRVVNLSSLAPGLTVPAFSEALRRAYARAAGTEPIEAAFPDPALYAETEKRLSSPEWLYGNDPPMSDELSGRFPWGGITLRFSAAGGVITDCIADSDSLDPEMPALAARALIGVPLRLADITAALADIPCGADIATVFADLPHNT